MVRCAASTAGVMPRRNSPSRFGDLQFARAPVPAAFVARHQSLLHQPVDDPGDGGAVEGNQSGKGHLIEPGIGADGRKRHVLNGREVVAYFLNFGQEHRHRNLLEAARQMSGHVMRVFHGTLRGTRDLTSILIISILSNS